MDFYKRQLWPECESAEMADPEYVTELVQQLGLPAKLAEHTHLTSFSDGSVCVKIVFDLEPTEVCCSYRLKKKFGA